MKTVVRTGLFSLLISICFISTITATEFRVIGFNNNTVALATVDEMNASVGDVFVVLDFEDNWFREVGRIRITKLLATGAVGQVISSPKSPTEWYHKVAIPEAAWDAETYQQWHNAEDPTVAVPPAPASAAAGRPRTNGVPRRRGGRPERPSQAPVISRVSSQSSVWNSLGWAKWVCYAAGAGSAAAALVYNYKAQNAWDDAQPGKTPEENAEHRQDAKDFQKLRAVYGWGSASMIFGGIILHEWELFDRKRQQSAMAQLQTSTNMAGVGLSWQIHW
jgi:hypothetical protein